MIIIQQHIDTYVGDVMMDSITFLQRISIVCYSLYRALY